MLENGNNLTIRLVNINAEHNFIQTESEYYTKRKFRYNFFRGKMFQFSESPLSSRKSIVQNPQLLANRLQRITKYL